MKCVNLSLDEETIDLINRIACVPVKLNGGKYVPGNKSLAVRLSVKFYYKKFIETK